MSERKFNREQNDTEPVKFKPLYLIVGICVVTITILACIMYVYLENNEPKQTSSQNENSDTNIDETVNEPIRYVIPQNACVKEITVSTYSEEVYNSCPIGNMVLNFTDMNTIVDINKTENNFTVNGIYYDMIEIEIDNYLKTGVFNKLAFSQVNQDLGMIITDANMAKKQGFYIFKAGAAVYSMGADSNTLFAFGAPIKYAKYSTTTTQVDCKTIDPNTVVYEDGTIEFDGTNYKAQFVRSVLASEYCK